MQRELEYSKHMITYLQAHETMILELLKKNDEQTDWKQITDMHERKLHYFQHERLVHLLVMITTIIATLLSFFFTFAINMLVFLILTFVLLILSIAYIVHYFKLENGVQRLYKLSDKIVEKIT